MGSEEQKKSWVGPCTIRPVRNFTGTWGYAISRRGATRALAALWGTNRARGDPTVLTMGVDEHLAAAAETDKLHVLLCLPNAMLHPGLRKGHRQTFHSMSYQWFV